MKEVVEKGDGLDGLSKAHFVGENDRVVLGPGVHHPVEALQLVVPQPFRLVPNELWLTLLLVELGSILEHLA